MSEMDMSLELEVKRIFKRAALVEAEVPQFLATRVLARLPEARAQQKKATLALGWSRLFWATLTSAAILIIVQPLLKNRIETESRLTAPVGRPIILAADLGLSDPALIEVELPQGVEFYSEKHPEVARENHLSIPRLGGWNAHQAPISVRANSPGVVLFRVKFLNEKSLLMEERWLEVEFKR